MSDVPRTGHPAVHDALEAAARLYDAKNQGYRSYADPMANFKQAAPVAKGWLTPLEYAYVLVSKQDDALLGLVTSCAKASREGCDTVTDGREEFERRGGNAILRERLMDGIVYRAIMIALLSE